MSMRVLVVDDEPAMRNALERALAASGYDVSVAANGTQALDRIAAERPDAIVLDVMLPDVDGFQVCRKLRSAGDTTPILMLTAKEAVADRVRGLEAGADDYLMKPFALAELVARLRAMARRITPERTQEPLKFEDLELDPQSYEARRGDRQLQLTRTEFALLELFMTHPRIVLTRQLIHEKVWGYDFGPGSNSLEVYVSGLRRKLEADGEARLIETVRGVGYVMREP